MSPSSVKVRYHLREKGGRISSEVEPLRAGSRASMGQSAARVALIRTRERNRVKACDDRIIVSRNENRRHGFIPPVGVAVHVATGGSHAARQSHLSSFLRVPQRATSRPSASARAAFASSARSASAAVFAYATW